MMVQPSVSYMLALVFVSPWWWPRSAETCISNNNNNNNNKLITSAFSGFISMEKILDLFFCLLHKYGS
jgi:hypothetical protein